MNESSPVKMLDTVHMGFQDSCMSPGTFDRKTSVATEHVRFLHTLHLYIAYPNDVSCA